MKTFGFSIIICFLAAILALTGCQQQTGQQGAAAQAFLGGDEGVVMTYVTGSPPDVVYDQGKFPFAVNLQVENKGEWDIMDPAKATITISGIDPASFGSPVLTGNIGQILAAKRKSLEGTEVAGGIAQVPFAGFNYAGTIAGDVDFTIRSSICYAYGSKATTKVCIKSDLLSMDQTTCTVSGAKEAQNSGAPVHITDIKEAPVGKDTLRLEFKLVHAGKGSIFKKDTSCSNKFEDKDLVYLKINTGIAQGAKCSGLQDAAGSQITGSEGYAKLFKDEKTGAYSRVITCTQQITAPGNFEKLVEFELTYDYQQFIDKKITVKHVG